MSSVAPEASSLADLSRNYRLTVGYQAITDVGSLSNWLYTLDASEVGPLKRAVADGRIITCQGPVHDVDTGRKIGYALYAQLSSRAPSAVAKPVQRAAYERELELA